MSTRQKHQSLDVDRMVADLDRGIVRDRAEDWLPDDLFGPQTAAERTAGHNGASAKKADTQQNGKRAGAQPNRPSARSTRAS